MEKSDRKRMSKDDWQQGVNIIRLGGEELNKLLIGIQC